MLIEKVLTLNDGKLHYWISKINSNKTLFFLHGAGIDHETFNEQYSYFQKEYNLITWDARWHGKSMIGFEEFNVSLLVNDLNSVLENEKIEKCILIGQSMGGNLAQEYAFRFKNKVEGLVLIDCTKNIQILTLYEKILMSTAKPMFILYPWNNLVNTMAKVSSVKKDIQEYMKRCFNHIGKSKFITVMMESRNFVHYENNFKYIDNILLICGEKDTTGNIKKVMSRWGLELGKNYHLILGAAHDANQDKPEEVNKIVGNFLKE